MSKAFCPIALRNPGGGNADLREYAQVLAPVMGALADRALANG